MMTEIDIIWMEKKTPEGAQVYQSIQAFKMAMADHKSHHFLNYRGEYLFNQPVNVHHLISTMAVLFQKKPLGSLSMRSAWSVPGSPGVNEHSSFQL